jgi:Lon protease-like protein
MTDSNKITVALFPIPGLIAFPGTVVPLHVFEPRYRSMVNDCIKDNRMIGVCHTKKEIRSAPSKQDMAKALNSNQATYQPYETFSAGHCEIIEILDDGRIHAEIHMSTRLRSANEVQTLPYRIVDAFELLDVDSKEDNKALQGTVNNRLVQLLRPKSPELAKMLQEEEWQKQSAAEFSFKIFQFMKFEPWLMQELLEKNSVQERLTYLDELLQQVG